MWLGALPAGREPGSEGSQSQGDQERQRSSGLWQPATGLALSLAASLCAGLARGLSASSLACAAGLILSGSASLVWIRSLTGRRALVRPLVRIGRTLLSTQERCAQQQGHS